MISFLHLLDKSAGISSFSALGALKRSLGTRKVGHAGTLDPFATGLLAALSGKLTKAAFLTEGLDKEYVSVFRFGRETDTLDTEGKVIAEAPVPSESRILSVLDDFRGDVVQRPPAFSAVKINGKRAYKQAREGRDVEMPERTVRVEELDVLSWDSGDLKVRIRCSKGTYIRSIARDLGLACGSRAYCRELRRTAIGPFRVEDASEPEAASVQTAVAPGDYFRLLGLPSVSCGARAAEMLRGGVPVERIAPLSLPDGELVFVRDDEDVPAALLEKKDGRWSYRIVFN